MRSVYFYKVENGKIIAVKRFTEKKTQRIIFIDVETDGLEFSFTINKNFSKKNIELFLNSKFKQYNEQRTRRETPECWTPTEVQERNRNENNSGTYTVCS